MKNTLKGLVTSFIESIDMLSYLMKNHHRRTTILAYYLGREMNLSEKELSDLVIAASIHDIGALTTQERDELIKMDIVNPNPHAMLGNYMVESFKPIGNVAKIIFYHHWAYQDDNKWIKEKGRVPLQSYILHVADRIEILSKENIPIVEQKKEILRTIRSYNGSLFHPDVIGALDAIASDDEFWKSVDHLDMTTILDMGMGKELDIELTLEHLEEFAYAMSKAIDIRSEFTTAHSFGVSAVAHKIATLLGYTDEKIRLIRVAGLLHDIGKIAIPIEIIDKKGRLTEEERRIVQEHAYYTFIILNDVKGLEDITKWASNHHEDHKGTGYPNHVKENLISEEMDIIAYSDIYAALSEERPYRKGLCKNDILKIMEEEFKEKHGERLFQLIKEHVDEIDILCKESIREGHKRFETFKKFTDQYVHIAS